jgi:hypothetical protein
MNTKIIVRILKGQNGHTQMDIHKLSVDINACAEQNFISFASL